MRDNELGHASGSPKQTFEDETTTGRSQDIPQIRGGAVDHLVGLALVLLEACLSHSPDDLVGGQHKVARCTGIRVGLCRAKPKPLRVDRHMLESCSVHWSGVTRTA